MLSSGFSINHPENRKNRKKNKPTPRDKLWKNEIWFKTAEISSDGETIIRDFGLDIVKIHYETEGSKLTGSFGF